MDLRALRINCLLAPLLPTVVAAVALAAVHLHTCEAIAAADHAEARAQLAAWAQHGENALADADPRWQQVEVLWLDHDRLHTHHGPDREPLPELIQAVEAPQSWTTPDGLLAAAALMAGPGPVRLLTAQRLPHPLPPPPWATLIALVGLGGVLAWYLARRIYRPVEALAEEAQAALDGRPPPAAMATSAETAAARSSITVLVDRYRSSSHGP